MKKYTCTFLHDEDLYYLKEIEHVDPDMAAIEFAEHAFHEHDMWEYGTGEWAKGDSIVVKDEVGNRWVYKITVETEQVFYAEEVPEW